MKTLRESFQCECGQAHAALPESARLTAPDEIPPGHYVWNCLCGSTHFTPESALDVLESGVSMV